MKSKFSRLSRPEVDEILDRTNFTDDELLIFQMMCKGKSLEEMCFKLSASKATISRRIKEIKLKVEDLKLKNGGDKMIRTIPIWEKVTLTVEETAEYSNIGINKISTLLNEPGCTFVLNVGKGKRLIKRKEFEHFIEKSREI